VFYILRPIRFLLSALTELDSPKQLAWGFAIGMVVGLVPKGNLTAIALMMFLCMLRVNLGIGMLSAFAFSWVGVWLDPISHRIGKELLSQTSLQIFWTELFDLPILPWTALNNTVVLGSFVLGMIAAIPVFWIVYPVLKKVTPAWSERVRKWKFVQMLWAAEVVERANGA